VQETVVGLIVADDEVVVGVMISHTIDVVDLDWLP
jgi:hypothetical protein